MIDNFKEKKLAEIRTWAWMAAVLPISALAGLFFIWVFGNETQYAYAMVSGLTIMFMTAVIWWWWAIYTVRNLVLDYSNNRDDLNKVIEDVKEISKELKRLHPGANP